jgi:scyllo-inositol 2-dehydrogenase (NADP+)
MTMPIRVASVGLGWVTRHRHIPALLRNPEFKLVGVIDRHPGHAADVSRAHKLPHYAQTADLADVSWLDSVDAITIGTAPMAHAAMAEAALAMGKHVLTEKPFAMNVAEGEAMVGAARAQRRVLAVVHNFQFSRAAKKLTADLNQGILGAIRRIAAVQFGNPRRRLPEWFEQLPLGLFYDESPHFFYLLRRFAGGDLRLQRAHAVPSLNEKLATPSLLSLMYRNGANIPVTIDCQFDSAVSEWYLMVTGEKGLGILDIFRDIYLRLPNDGSHALPHILRTSACAIAQHVLQHVPNGIAYLRGRLDYGNDEVFARFAEAIQGEAAAVAGMSAEDALAILRMQHEATTVLQDNLLK